MIVHLEAVSRFAFEGRLEPQVFCVEIQRSLQVFHLQRDMRYADDRRPLHFLRARHCRNRGHNCNAPEHSCQYIKMRWPRTLVLIWVCFAARLFFYAAMQPLWEGYDEWAHFSVIRLMAGGHLLVDRNAPVPADIDASMDTW